MTPDNLMLNLRKRSFQGQNLEGQNFINADIKSVDFTGANLIGANFSGADIRSANFTRANLKDANFSHVKAGLQKRWNIFLVLVSWLISGLAGFLAAFVGTLISSIFKFNNSNLSNQVLSETALIIVIVVLIVIIRYGLNSAGAFAVAFVGAVAVAVAFAVVVARGFVVAEAISVGFAFAFAFAFAVAFVGVVAVTFAVAVAGAVAFAFATAFVGAVAGAFVVTVAVAAALVLAGAGAVPGAFVLAGAGALLSIYMSKQALKGDKKYVFILNIAIAFAAFRGTSFRNADLTNANFTQANLKGTDFRKANLTRTYFYKTKMLDRVRPGITYLQNPQVRDVLMRGEGNEKTFSLKDLRGVNFKDISLIDTNFNYTNLSDANLQNANLSRAKLVGAQLDGTDFTNATLTGAYIEDWYITRTTKFDGVLCEYVYMRLPTKENPVCLRKPDNNEEFFTDGQFEDFIKPIFDTLDLYHNQNVNPRAIAVALKQLVENNQSAELKIVGLERRGEDKILLRVKTAATANKSELSKEYFINYNQLKALAEKDFKVLIEENQSRIRELTNFIAAILPKSYINIEKQGGTIMTGDYFNQSGNFGVGINKGEINTEKLAGTINEAQQRNLAETASQIQQLLKQLEEANPTITEAERTTVVIKAADEIRNNPALKARVIGALKSGGKEAFKEAVDNPLVNILIAIVEGWQEA